MKIITIENDSKYTILLEGIQYLVVPTNNSDIVLKGGTLEQCREYVKGLEC